MLSIERKSKYTRHKSNLGALRIDAMEIRDIMRRFDNSELKICSAYF